MRPRKPVQVLARCARSARSRGQATLSQSTAEAGASTRTMRPLRSKGQSTLSQSTAEAGASTRTMRPLCPLRPLQRTSELVTILRLEHAGTLIEHATWRIRGLLRICEGGCTRGNQCKYSHDVPASEEKEGLRDGSMRSWKEVQISQCEDEVGEATVEANVYRAMCTLCDGSM
jgi:hypothetical protein